jgi:hypothetical protein
MTEGARANTQIFSLRPKDAKYLLDNAKNGPVTLEISYKSRQVKIENLYVLQAAPQDNPHVAKVVVADRRVWWGHRIIRRDYNVRRNDGVIRFVNQLAPQETATTTPIVRYWPWSLFFAVNNSYKAWKVSDMFRDILEDVLTVEKEKFGVSLETEYFTDGGKDKTDQVELENQTYVGDGGEAALERLKSTSPAVGIKLKPDGTVVVFRKDIGDQTASEATWGMGPPIDGGGVLIDMSNAMLRPGKIIIRMEREVEIRLDSIEESQNNGQTVADPDLEHRGMWNVGQVTDPFLLLTGDKYPQGTWMTMRDLVRLFPSRAGMKLTERHIREALVPFGPDLWQLLVNSSLSNPNVEWGARISMIQNCYRRVFQVHWKYLSRIRSLRDYRISTVNQSTGARAPASVYSDYATMPSMRGATQGLVFNQPERGLEEETLVAADTVAFTNFKCWAPLIKDAKPAPAFVRILDADQGIILIDYQLDLMGMAMSVMPGLITPNPTLDIRYQDMLAHVLTTDSVVEGGENAEHPALSDTYRLSVIMSAVPAAPNDNRKLHSIEITPAMVEQKYGVKVGACNGPTMEIYIGPNVNTAKIAWQDDRADDIDRCFGLGSKAEPNLEGLIINAAESNAVVGASIQGTALAAAAQIYSSLIDRPEGQQEGLLTGAQEISGWKDKVVHSLSGAGKLRTGISFPGRIPRLNISEWMDSNMRRAILQLAQPPT